MKIAMTKQVTLTILASVFFYAGCFADETTISTTFDRWMYPFNVTSGIRATGSTFGAINNPAFDDHDAQILIGFDTAGGIPTGQSPANYDIQAITVSLTTANPTDQSFELDSTYDALATYLDSTADNDAGRPVELYGVGTRNGFIGLSFVDGGAGPPFFEENESFGFPGPPRSEARHVFPSDYAEGTPRDISNSVRNSIETNPWAVGTVEGLDDGNAVPRDSALTFSLDVSNPDVMAYLQNGLNDGELFFSVVSMHSSVQGSSAGIPVFHLGDANRQSAGEIASMSIDYQIVPEPSSVFSVILAIGALVRIIRKND